MADITRGAAVTLTNRMLKKYRKAIGVCQENKDILTPEAKAIVNDYESNGIDEIIKQVLEDKAFFSNYDNDELYAFFDSCRDLLDNCKLKLETGVKDVSGVKDAKKLSIESDIYRDSGLREIRIGKKIVYNIMNDGKSFDSEDARKRYTVDWEFEKLEAPGMQAEGDNIQTNWFKDTYENNSIDFNQFDRSFTFSESGIYKVSAKLYERDGFGRPQLIDIISYEQFVEDNVKGYIKDFLDITADSFTQSDKERFVRKCIEEPEYLTTMLKKFNFGDRTKLLAILLDFGASTGIDNSVFEVPKGKVFNASFVDNKMYINIMKPVPYEDEQFELDDQIQLPTAFSKVSFYYGDDNRITVPAISLVGRSYNKLLYDDYYKCNVDFTKLSENEKDELFHEFLHYYLGDAFLNQFLSNPLGLLKTIGITVAVGVLLFFASEAVTIGIAIAGSALGAVSSGASFIAGLNMLAPAYEMKKKAGSIKELKEAAKYTAEAMVKIGVNGIMLIASLLQFGEACYKGRKLYYKNKSVSVGENSRIETSNETVTYRRVQGGTGDLCSQERILVDSEGNVYINNPDSNLNVSIDNGEHSQYFLKNHRPGGEIVEFDVPKWFDDMVKEFQIPQECASTNPMNQGGMAPKVVDPTKVKNGRCIEFPPPWIEWLNEYAKNGRIIN